MQTMYFWKSVRDDEEGGVSVEQILWLGAGAVILLFLISVIFPPVRHWVLENIRDILKFRARS